MVWAEEPNRKHGQQPVYSDAAIQIVDGTSIAIDHRLDFSADPISLEIGNEGIFFWLTIKAPYSDTHPAWRKNGLDGLLRIDPDELFIE